MVNGTPESIKALSVYGYAYSNEGATQKAAIVMLIIYCLLAIFHILKSLQSGLTSGAWDTAPELTTLAYNSERTDAMYNTGVGIQSIRTLEQKVLVRSRNNCLELVTADTAHNADVIKPGHLYH